MAVESRNFCLMSPPRHASAPARLEGDSVHSIHDSRPAPPIPDFKAEWYLLGQPTYQSTSSAYLGPLLAACFAGWIFAGYEQSVSTLSLALWSGVFYLFLDLTNRLIWRDVRFRWILARGLWEFTTLVPNGRWRCRAEIIANEAEYWLVRNCLSIHDRIQADLMIGWHRWVRKYQQQHGFDLLDGLSFFAALLILLAFSLWCCQGPQSQEVLKETPPATLSLADCRDPFCLTAESARTHPFNTWISQRSSDYSLFWLANATTILSTVPGVQKKVGSSITRSSPLWKVASDLNHVSYYLERKRFTFVEERLAAFNSALKDLSWDFDTQSQVLFSHVLDGEKEKDSTLYHRLSNFFSITPKALAGPKFFNSLRNRILTGVMPLGHQTVQHADAIQKDLEVCRALLTPFLGGVQAAIEAGQTPSDKPCNSSTAIEVSSSPSCHEAWEPILHELKTKTLYIDFIDVNLFAARNRALATLSGLEVLDRYLHNEVERLWRGSNPFFGEKIPAAVEVRDFLSNLRRTIAPPHAGLASYASRAGLLASKQWAFHYSDEISKILEGKRCGDEDFQSCVRQERALSSAGQSRSGSRGFCAFANWIMRYASPFQTEMPTTVDPAESAIQSLESSWFIYSTFRYPSPSIQPANKDNIPFLPIQVPEWYEYWSGRSIELSQEEDSDIRQHAQPLNEKMLKNWKSYKSTLNEEVCLMVGESIGLPSCKLEEEIWCVDSPWKKVSEVERRMFLEDMSESKRIRMERAGYEDPAWGEQGDIV
ncbi:Hypothetical predicted protein [Lecanosticta acicola]|uniref:Uncharacterized protein n=1 Tax=Lecanosticta acicola TaxID=111012 RepID=A0AAI8YYK4_9PEZI|nr:Hypothetical predicted protein [Lecanosticta acicola]